MADLKKRLRVKSTFCPCGSGKPKAKCHKDLNRHQIRNVIKYDIFDVKTGHFVTFGSYYRYEPLKTNTYKCKIRFIKAITPAGMIVYPLLITHGSKSLRPLTIDGLSFFEENGTIYQIIHCTITPIAGATILINMEDAIVSGYGKSIADCTIMAGGNPFQSLYALETKHNAIALYHHTTANNKRLIIESGKMKASNWNLRGTRELSAHGCVYLTDLDQILDSFDLQQIAMTAQGTKMFVCTDSGNAEELLVYRDSVGNRTESLKIWIDPDLLSPNPLILHDPAGDSENDFSWWEVFLPSIFRVVVAKGEFLPISFYSTSNDFHMVRNEHYIEENGFIAGHGNDIESLKRISAEEHAGEMIRSGRISPADYGLPDPKWLKTWEKNLASIVKDRMERQIF
ncbi:MAG: hypothetical protein ACLP51_08805 [Syntrophobacteraceae bacterium]